MVRGNTNGKPCNGEPSHTGTKWINLTYFKYRFRLIDISFIK